MSSVRKNIEKKLKSAFKPHHLNVVDDSALHAGHAGAPAGGESHFRIEIVADKFRGKSRIACHRMINSVLSDELSQTIHALQIKARAFDDKA